MRYIPFILISLAGTPAVAHDFYETYTQPSGAPCCGGDDCAPIPDSAVSIDPKAGTVTLTFKPGEHPSFPNGGTVTSDRVGIHRSPDIGTHACAKPSRVFCVFIGGVV